MSENQICEVQRQAYLENLYSQALNGNVDAGEELSSIALGGLKLAQELVRKMDDKLAQGNKSNLSITNIATRT
jgi:hypothetical protein